MEIITDRLLIRELKPEDEEAFIGMASDGSLTDIFGDCRNCRQWMGGWIREARALCEAGDPFRDYLAYALETREDHVVIGSVGSTYYEDAGQVGVTYFIGAACRGRGVPGMPPAAAMGRAGFAWETGVIECSSHRIKCAWLPSSLPFGGGNARPLR